MDDLPTYLQKSARLGGRTLMPPKEIPGVATLAPEGNRVGLIKG